MAPYLTLFASSASSLISNHRRDVLCHTSDITNKTRFRAAQNNWSPNFFHFLFLFYYYIYLVQKEINVYKKIATFQLLGPSFEVFITKAIAAIARQQYRETFSCSLSSSCLFRAAGWSVKIDYGISCWHDYTPSSISIQLCGFPTSIINLIPIYYTYIYMSPYMRIVCGDSRSHCAAFSQEIYTQHGWIAWTMTCRKLIKLQ